MRELFRRNKEKFPPGSDVIVVVTRNMVGKRYAELEEELYSIRQLDEENNPSWSKRDAIYSYHAYKDLSSLSISFLATDVSFLSHVLRL